MRFEKRFLRYSFYHSLFVIAMLCGIPTAHAEVLGSSSTTFDLSGSSGKSSDSSGSTSDSTKPDPNQARKVIVPMRARDEAALWLATDTLLPQSALLRSTLQAFRRVLAAEGKCTAAKKCTDTEVVFLLLARIEAPRG